MIETGINSIGLMRFLVQLAAATAAALALWGFIFSFVNIKIAKFIARLFLAALGFLGIAWFLTAIIYFPPAALAHEGIAIGPINEFIQNGFNLNFWLIAVLLIFNIIFARKKLRLFFLVNFSILFLFLTFTTWTGFWGKERLFFSLHNIHSIFTLGSVVTVDILYLLSLKKKDWAPIIYKIFPAMSAVIWAGLGIDFLSVFLALPETLVLTPQFYFSQIVVAIIILNGAMFSGKINDILARLKQLSPGKRELIHLFGAVSIASWLSITFADFFEFSASLVFMFSVYAIFIILAFIAHKLILRLIKAGG